MQWTIASWLLTPLIAAAGDANLGGNASRREGSGRWIYVGG